MTDTERIAELEAERGKLQKALVKYGRHKHWCPYRDRATDELPKDSACTCGWVKAFDDTCAGTGREKE